MNDEVDHQHKSHPMKENITTSLANGLRRLVIRLIRAWELLVRVEYKYVRYARNEDKKKIIETCEICFEDIHVDQMLLITGCHHSYCFSCMSKHVEFELLQGVLPKCPHENCETKLELDNCKGFLSPKLMNMMSKRYKEALVPADDRIYCPNPRCSSLLSKRGLQRYEGGSRGARKCPNCSAIFCIKCNVPWHDNMSCSDYKRLNPHANREERELQALAAQEQWRQCPNCSDMVSLASGCNHVYCRCGYYFCYKCGATWPRYLSRRPTCTCYVIWDIGGYLTILRERLRRIFFRD